MELALDEAGGLSMNVVSVVLCLEKKNRGLAALPFYLKSQGDENSHAAAYRIEVSPSLVGESGSGWEVESVSTVNLCVNSLLGWSTLPASFALRNESGIGACRNRTIRFHL